METKILIEGHTGITLTEKQIKEMKHALGLDWKNKPYRNFYCLYSADESWDELVKLGLATLHIIPPNELDLTTYYYYHVSEEGAKIFNEYGEEIKLLKFKELVEEKRKEKSNHAKTYPDGNFLDKDGNSFTKGEFS